MVRQLLHSKTFILGNIIVLFWVFWAILPGSRLTPHDPLEQTSDIRSLPSSAYSFGTDQFGRDIFSRVLAGATSTLMVAPLATLLAIVCGPRSASSPGTTAALPTTRSAGSWTPSSRCR